MSAGAALALPPAAPPARPRVLLVGTALAAAASVMAIVGLVGVYLAQRALVLHDGAPWLPDGASLPLTPANVAMGTMLLSAVTMWWAVDSVGRNDRPGAYLALGITMVFGIAVINSVSVEMARSAIPVSTTMGLLFYTINALGIAMIIAGLAYAAVMTFRTLGGEYQGRDREGLVAASLFWYVTIAVQAVIWYAIFVTK
ncbi:MAG: cytochrome c oxidase subunit 3 [Acidimicrobiales bacterium]